MIFSRSNPFYYIKKVKDHKKNRKGLLELFYAYGSNFYPRQSYTIVDHDGDYTSVVSNTNWEKTNHQEPTFSIALSQRDQISFKEFVCKKYNKEGIVIQDQWFNQYYSGTGSDHPWHTHHDPSSPVNNDLSCIYYIELEDKSLRTVFLNPDNGKEFVPPVNEGEIVIFKSDIPHKSPRNFTKTRKTVVSFNLRFFNPN